MVFSDPYAADQVEVKTGITAQAFLGADLTRFATAEAGFAYAHRGFIDGGAHFGSVSMHYLQIPVRVRFSPPWDVAPYVALGATASVMVGCAVDGVARQHRAPCDDPLVGTSWQRFDAAATAALGVSFPMSGGTAFLEGTAAMGLPDLKRESLPPGSARSAALGLALGFRLPTPSPDHS